MEIDEILDKRARNKEYFKYLVKGQGHMVKDLTWIIEKELQLQGFKFAKIEEKYFVPLEFDAGASCSDHYLV